MELAVLNDLENWLQQSNEQIESLQNKLMEVTKIMDDNDHETDSCRDQLWEMLDSVKNLKEKNDLILKTALSTLPLFTEMEDAISNKMEVLNEMIDLLCMQTDTDTIIDTKDKHTEDQKGD